MFWNINSNPSHNLLLALTTNTKLLVCRFFHGFQCNRIIMGPASIYTKSRPTPFTTYAHTFQPKQKIPTCISMCFINFVCHLFCLNSMFLCEYVDFIFFPHLSVFSQYFFFFIWLMLNLYVYFISPLQIRFPFLFSFSTDSRFQIYSALACIFLHCLQKSKHTHKLIPTNEQKQNFSERETREK